MNWKERYSKLTTVKVGDKVRIKTGLPRRIGNVTVVPDMRRMEGTEHYVARVEYQKEIDLVGHIWTWHIDMLEKARVTDK